MSIAAQDSFLALIAVAAIAGAVAAAYWRT